MSYKGEVFVDEQWVSNGLRFRTEAEALAYADNLYERWHLCTDYQATESSDTATHAYYNGAVGDLV